MAISVADNFSYKGAKPLDARIQYSTVANMKNATASDLYDGCLAYVTETKKNYQYDSSNTVDPTTGKWRELQTGGGGGASAFSDLTDVDLDNLENGQVAKYNSTSEMWENGDINKTMDYADFQDLSTEEKNNGTAYFLPDASVVSNFTVMGNRFDKANIYTTDERMIGSWMGKPLYQKVIEFPSQKTIGTSWVDVGVNIENGETVVYSCGMYNAENPVTWVSAKITSNKLYVTSAGITSYINKLIIQYTKTNDATVSIGTGNDYLTDEQIIGTWIDGKKLYQKTVTFAVSTGWTVFAHSIANVDSIFMTEGFVKNSSGATRMIGGSTGDSDLFCAVEKTNINIYNSDSNSTSATVTIRYTKTTD